MNRNTGDGKAAAALMIMATLKYEFCPLFFPGPRVPIGRYAIIVSSRYLRNSSKVSGVLVFFPRVFLAHSIAI